MSKRVRLDPEEVKREMREREERERAEPVFHNPFAAAADQLAKVKVKPEPKEKAPRAKPEPSVLAEARARNRARREAIATAIKPLVRKGRVSGESVERGGAREKEKAVTEVEDRSKEIPEDLPPTVKPPRLL